ncbi:alpha/beta hydrolase [Virgisporangium ochraceum]|uniref:Alpha/beta hydrolase n=1 Tax=Virgisporangium ochraceum TaxID=65505 RepID=A0A8J4EGG0_9ACTN|nr:alpha/beta hydrolase [Virgisporangium ochraceum]GIJ71082.1 alpha/beta hydrolase [Virgisporangium ochraceum]
MTLSATDPTVYNLVGRLCLRTDGVRGSKTVQLLVPGMTYDQNVFNLSHSPNSYSYVYAATSRGYSTFAIDRLGTGLSAKPAPDLLTLQSHAYVVGQLTQKLRAGTIGGRAFTTVVGVGHSFGAAIMQYLAGTSTVAGTVPDYLVLGGFLTAGNAPILTLFANSLQTATADPKFAGSGLPAGYLTTVAGIRDDLMLHVPGVETAMPAQDESIKSLSTVTERLTIGAARDPAVMGNVRVPVYIVVGQYDGLFCNEATGISCANAAAVRARELPNFTNARTCLSTYVVPNSGHTYGLHVRGLDAYTATSNWIDLYTFSGTKNANGCVV